MNDLPSEIGKKIISLTSPTAAHYISYVNPELSYLESLEAIRYEYKDFIDAVNRGDYDEVVRLIPKIPIEIIQDLQNDFKFFHGYERILLNKNEDYFYILLLLISSGMKISLRNMKILVDTFERIEKTLDLIFLFLPLGDGEWYVDELIETYGVGEYLKTLAFAFRGITNIHFHILFVNHLLNLVDSHLDQIEDETLLVFVLKVEDDNLKTLPSNLRSSKDIVEARELIYNRFLILNLTLRIPIPLIIGNPAHYFMRRFHQS